MENKKEKLCIGLYTSGSRIKIAVKCGDYMRSASRKIFSQETVLFPMLEKLLPPGMTVRDIEQVCALKGPGRFTGIRIGLTVAGTLNALSGAEILTATSFDILACQAADSYSFRKSFPNGGLVAVLTHAFREEYFCAFYDVPAQNGNPVLRGQPSWLQRAEAEKLLASADEPFFCIADEQEKPDIYSLLPENTQKRISKAPKNISCILPEYLIYAPQRLGSHDIRPLYLKLAKFELDAIEKKLGKQ